MVRRPFFGKGIIDVAAGEMARQDDSSHRFRAVDQITVDVRRDSSVYLSELEGDCRLVSNLIRRLT